MVIPPAAHTPVPNQPPLCGGWALTGSQARCNLQQQTFTGYILPSIGQGGAGVLQGGDWGPGPTTPQLPRGLDRHAPQGRGRTQGGQGGRQD